MIQEPIPEEQKPGKNAIPHVCEMKVEILGDDGEASTFKKCQLTALRQCLECTAWICGTEGLDHCVICVRCGQPFCSECWPFHRLANSCLPEAA